MKNLIILSVAVFSLHSFAGEALFNLFSSAGETHETRETDGTSLPDGASEAGFVLGQDKFEDGKSSPVLQLPVVDLGAFHSALVEKKQEGRFLVTHGRFTNFKFDKTPTGSRLSLATSNGEAAEITINKNANKVNLVESDKNGNKKTYEDEYIDHYTGSAIHNQAESTEAHHGKSPWTLAYNAADKKITATNGKQKKDFAVELPEGIVPRFFKGRYMVLSDEKGNQFREHWILGDASGKNLILDLSSLLGPSNEAPNRATCSYILMDSKKRGSTMRNGTQGDSLQSIVDYWLKGIRAQDIEKAVQNNLPPVTRDGYRQYTSTTGKSRLFVKVVGDRLAICPGQNWDPFSATAIDGKTAIVDEAGTRHLIKIDHAGGAYSATQLKRPPSE